MKVVTAISKTVTRTAAVVVTMVLVGLGADVSGCEQVPFTGPGGAVYKLYRPDPMENGSGCGHHIKGPGFFCEATLVKESYSLLCGGPALRFQCVENTGEGRTTVRAMVLCLRHDRWYFT